jgi:hypothetical protein
MFAEDKNNGFKLIRSEHPLEHQYSRLSHYLGYINQIKPVPSKWSP